MNEEAAGILLMANDLTVSRLVAATLAGQTRFGGLTLCGHLHDLASRLEQRAAPAAIVDIDPDPASMLPQIEPLTARFRETRFVLLSREPDNDLLLEAMQIGARHLMSKGAIATQLGPVLDRLTLSGAGSAVAHGRLYTVLSSAGGCGATTIAVNLANELRLCRPQDPVLLVDLDTAGGGAAVALGVRADYGVADVLVREGPPDPQLIRSSAAACGNGLHMLLSPASVDFAGAEPLPYDHLPRLTAACRMAYPCTVIDAPRVPMAAAASLAAASHAVLIVLQLNVRDIRMARQIRQGLLDRGVPAERILLLVNRYHKRHGMIEMEEAQRALGPAGLVPLSNDYTAVSRSLNLGQPLAQAAPSTPLRRDIRKIMDQLSAADQTVASAARMTGAPTW